MSFGIFLNFEKLSMSIIEAEIAQMTNENVLHYEDAEDEINEEKFIHNLYHGCIVATFIVNLYETTLNTILRKLKCKEAEILKTSHEVKLQLICKMCKVDISDIKRDNSHSCMRAIVKLRNDITHFKSNLLAMGHFIPADTKVPMGTSKETLATQFTKDYLEYHYNEVLKLLELICRKCGFELFVDCGVITNDGVDPDYEFVATPRGCG